MKRILWLTIGFMGIATILPAQLDTAKIDGKAVTAWIRKNSVPIKSIDAGSGFSDLKPLIKTFKDVDVVGLGEATHGTREFFKMKHRLVEFLVTQMNFTAFVLESNYSGCQPINDYILYGKGDRATVLTGQDYLVWDNEEFSALLDWLRIYNQKVSDDKKVRFYGLDMRFNGLGREKVLVYVKKYLPERMASIDSVFQVLASEEAKWPSRLNESALQKAFINLQKVKDYLTSNKNRLVAASSADEWGKIQQYTKIMEQSILANVADTPPTLTSKKLGRHEYMGQNMLDLMDQEKPNTKFIVWAYNGHIERSDSSWKSIGYYLKGRLKEKYFALAFESDKGTFQTRVLQPDKFWGELKIDTLPPIEKSITWYFAQANKGILFIDCRLAHSDVKVKKWMETPQKIGEGYWIYRGAKENTGILKLKDNFDGILFIERSTPAHPTKNAIGRSLKKIGV